MKSKNSKDDSNLRPHGTSEIIPQIPEIVWEPIMGIDQKPELHMKDLHLSSHAPKIEVQFKIELQSPTSYSHKDYMWKYFPTKFQ